MIEETEDPPEVVVANVAARVAARYARRVFWADRDDLEQEAMVAGYSALRTWDAACGVPLAGYVWSACSKQLGRYALKTGSPVSASWKRAPELVGSHRAELDEGMIEGTPWSDELLVDADWKFRVHEQLEFVLNAGNHGDAAWKVLVDEQKPAAVAEELGLPIAHVYKATERARERIARNALLFDMLKEIDEA